MNPWSNIEVSPDDPEIARINDVENSLGELPEDVTMIRELITRFEACHFKYRTHLEKIRDSISKLIPAAEPSTIGSNHIQHGEQVLQADKTGKSLMGQQYVWAIREWLQDQSRNDMPAGYDESVGKQVHQWLGDRTPDKERLVRLLLARLTWDWNTYEASLHDDEFRDIEYQACRMDICHYAFPGNLDRLLEAMGRMQAVGKEEFEGCGSFNAGIRADLEKEFRALNETLGSPRDGHPPDRDDRIRMWLSACLAKTIKEQVKIPVPVHFP